MTPEEFERLAQRLESKIESIFLANIKKMKGDRIGGVELAMEVLGWKKATIYQYVSEKKIPFKRVNRSIRFSEKELRKFMIGEDAIMPEPAIELIKKKRGRASLLQRALAT